MRVLTLSDSSFRDVVAETVACLKSGGVIAAPTETVYGLMTCWGNKKGREQIYQLKARDENKLLQMLAAGTGSKATGGQMLPDKRLTDLVKKFCPGALTIVTQGVDGTVGLRVPDCPFILAVLRALGEPLAATSANLSGCPPAVNADQACKDLQGQPDLLVDGGTVQHGSASTVISLLNEDVELLREGPIFFEDIQHTLNKDNGT